MPLLAELIVAVVIGYAVGSLPTAYLAGRFFKKTDIRRLGDGNVGAENAYRELGPQIGVGVLIIDIGKGALAVLLIKVVGLGTGPILSAGAAAVAGHNWPVLLQFKGGRGAATTVGALLIALYPAALISGGLGILVLLWGTGEHPKASVRSLLPREFSGTAACAATFIPMPFLGWAFGYSVAAIVYSIALPTLVGAVHFYQVILPSESPIPLPVEGPPLTNSLAIGPDDPRVGA